MKSFHAKRGVPAKKILFALFLVIFIAAAGFGQTGPKDLIVLLDTSASMSVSYQEVRDYISGAMLKEHLRMGDTFHLIPFSGTASLDIARRIESRGELETIIGRMFLQFPLNPWSDIPGALSFAEKYASSLPVRPKKIILITDGLVALPPGSSGGTDTSGLDKLINDSRNRLNKDNISIVYIKAVPGKPLPKAAETRTAQASPSPARTPVRPPAPAATQENQGTASGGQNTTVPQQTQASGQQQNQAQAETQTQGGEQTLPGEQTSSGSSAGTQTAPDQALIPQASGAETTGTEVSGSAESTEQGQTSQDMSSDENGPGFPGQSATEEQPSAGAGSSDNTTVPSEPVSSGTQTSSSVSHWEGPPVWVLILLALIGLALLILIIYLISKELQGRPNKVVARAASPAASVRPVERPFADNSKELASFAASQSRQRVTPYQDRIPKAAMHKPEDTSGPIMLNLFVEDQNTLIGKRNLHSLKSGVSFTVGGGKSDYLIFLVPIPQAIGIIHRDGDRYTFVPKKPQYFPDIGSHEVPDCIGKTIRIISDKKYELRFRFEWYEDPLRALNKMLNSVKIPG